MDLQLEGGGGTLSSASLRSRNSSASWGGAILTFAPGSRERFSSIWHLMRLLVLSTQIGTAQHRTSLQSSKVTQLSRPVPILSVRHSRRGCSPALNIAVTSEPAYRRQQRGLVSIRQSRKPANGGHHSKDGEQHWQFLSPPVARRTVAGLASSSSKSSSSSSLAALFTFFRFLGTDPAWTPLPTSSGKFTSALQGREAVGAGREVA